MHNYTFLLFTLLWVYWYCLLKSKMKWFYDNYPREKLPPATPKLTLIQTLTLSRGRFSSGTIVWMPPNPMWGWEVIFRTPIKYTLPSFTFLLILLICVFEQCFEILCLVNNPAESFCFVQNTESLLWNFLEC